MTEGKLRLEIVTPYGPVFGSDVDEVTAAGSEGEFGVLPGHSSFITTLKIGVLACKEGNSQKFFFVNWGYAEVGHDRVLVLADSAEESKDIDVERAKAAKARAEDRLKKDGEVDFRRAETSLERAVMRMQVAEKRSGKIEGAP